MLSLDTAAQPVTHTACPHVVRGLESEAEDESVTHQKCFEGSRKAGERQACLLTLYRYHTSWTLSTFLSHSSARTGSIYLAPPIPLALSNGNCKRTLHLRR